MLCCSTSLEYAHASSLDDKTPPAAQGCYAMTVIEFVQGAQSNAQMVGPDRSNPSKALNEPDRSNAADGFVSLGVGGHIILEFGGPVYDQTGDDIKVFETSFSGNTCGHSYGDGSSR